jgi:hypothetical protein
MELAMWDGNGGIRVMDMRSGASRELTWNTDPPWRIGALAAHPQFLENRQLYVVEMPASRDSLRLSRYREVGNVLGERAVLMQTALDARAERTSMSFGPDGDLYIALLASTDPPGETASQHDRFLLRVTAAGVSAQGNPSGSLFAPVSGPAPVAMAWAADSTVPWMLSRVPPDAYTVKQPGQPQPVEHRLYPASPPIAMQIVTIDNQQTLFVTGNRGDVRRLGRNDTGWWVRDGFRLSATGRAVGDALVLGTGEMAACGPVDGTGYGVWRVRLP